MNQLMVVFGDRMRCDVELLPPLECVRVFLRHPCLEHVLCRPGGEQIRNRAELDEKSIDETLIKK